jgi:hypothetical protein
MTRINHTKNTERHSAYRGAFTPSWRMHMSDLSRRSLVTSAAALPALAVPAVAVAAANMPAWQTPKLIEQLAEPDPIFAALERWKELAAIEEDAYTARSNADDAFSERHGFPYPSGLTKGASEAFETNGIKNADLCFSTHKEISAMKKRAPWLAKATPHLHRVLNRQTADYEANVKPCHEAADSAFEDRYAAMEAVFEMVPTTLAGMRAKIDFAMSASHVTECLMEANEPLQNFLDTLYEAARLMAARS